MHSHTSMVLLVNVFITNKDHMHLLKGHTCKSDYSVKDNIHVTNTLLKSNIKNMLQINHSSRHQSLEKVVESTFQVRIETSEVFIGCKNNLYTGTADIHPIHAGNQSVYLVVNVFLAV